MHGQWVWRVSLHASEVCSAVTSAACGTPSPSYLPVTETAASAAAAFAACYKGWPHSKPLKWVALLVFAIALIAVCSSFFFMKQARALPSRSDPTFVAVPLTRLWTRGAATHTMCASKSVCTPDMSGQSRSQAEQVSLSWVKTGRVTPAQMQAKQVSVHAARPLHCAHVRCGKGGRQLTTSHLKLVPTLKKAMHCSPSIRRLSQPAVSPLEEKVFPR